MVKRGKKLKEQEKKNKESCKNKKKIAAVREE